jgi:hypothetical protein
LAGAGALNVLMGLIFLLTVVVFFLIYLGPYRHPGWISPGFAGALLLLGVIAFSTGEFIREAVRKPFVVYNVVLGNQVLPKDIPAMREQGYLESGVWTKAFVAKAYPQVMAGDEDDEDEVPPTIDGGRLLKLPHKDRVRLGEVLFLHHCNDCHAAALGYSAAGRLTQGWPREAVRWQIDHLHDVLFMPPWCGTKDEAELLTDYLMDIRARLPMGMNLKTERENPPTDTSDMLGPEMGGP